MAVAEKTVDPIVATWRKYKKKKTIKVRNELVEQYLSLVRYIAERIKSKLPNTVRLEDLMSAGVFGLLDAIDKYDLERDVKFETYCATRVRGAILDELRKLDWVPRLVRSNAHQIEEASRDIQQKLGRLPTDEELAEGMGLSMEDFDNLANSASAASMVPFSTRFYEDGESRSEQQGADLMEDERSVDPARLLQKAELKDVITRELSERERLVVLLYYFDELTLKEIGAVLDLSESRVCQIHSRVLLRLKGILGPNKEGLWPN